MISGGVLEDDSKLQSNITRLRHIYRLSSNFRKYFSKFGKIIENFDKSHKKPLMTYKGSGQNFKNRISTQKLKIYHFKTTVLLASFRILKVCKHVH